MKDKILELMPRYCGVYQSGTIGELQQNAFANKLTALMCYEIVKAYYRAYAEFPGELSWEEFTAEVEGHYLEEFDGNGELLRQSIEKVKTDQP